MRVGLQLFLRVRDGNSYNQKLYIKMDKENSTAHKQPLGNTNNNTLYQTPKGPNKSNKQDQLISAVQQEISTNKGCDLLNVLLSDPLLKQLNMSLQKQAQQQKRSKLLDSFPLRYQNLVHTQLLYRKVQNQMKEHQKQSKEVIQMLQQQKYQKECQIGFFKVEMEKKDEQVIKEKHEMELVLKKKDEYLDIKIEEKQAQVVLRDQKINDLERKVIKIKCEKDNIVEFIDQLKEETQTLKKENQRIVGIVTQNEVELSSLRKQLEEKEKNYQLSKENFMTQITQSQLQCSEKVNHYQSKFNEMKNERHGIKARLKECQNEIVDLLKDKQELENDYFDQVQEIRSQHLQVVREKNILEEQMENLIQQNELKDEELQSKISYLEKEISKKDENELLSTRKNCDQIKNLKDCLNKQQMFKDETIKVLSEQLEESKCDNDKYKEKIIILQTEKKEIQNELCQLRIQINQFHSQLSNNSQQKSKNDHKNKQIEQMIKILKDQLQKMRPFIDQKEVKIQQYRQQILSLRQKVKQTTISKQESNCQVTRFKQIADILSTDKVNLLRQVDKYKAKQIIMKAQIQTYYNLLNKQTTDATTQIQRIEGFKNQEELELERLQIKNQKICNKYQNAVEELQQYKKQFELEREEKEEELEHFQHQNQTLKEQIKNNMFESSQIEQVLDSKINELKDFYEQKMDQENKKYKTIIGTLRKQMTELYNEIDLKKSIEEEMYQQMIKINEERQNNQL